MVRAGARMPQAGRAFACCLAALFALGEPVSAQTERNAELADAARAGDLQAVEALLATDASIAIDAEGTDGTPALHWLVRGEHTTLVDAVLHAGANPNQPSRYGILPVDLAAANGSGQLIRVLTAAGADPNSRNQLGETVLMTATESGSEGAVTALLDAGADVQARDSTFQQTALMIAARRGDENVAALLIRAGTDVDAATRVGDEPEWILPNSRPGFSFGVGIIRGGLPEDRGMRPFRRGGMTALHFAAREGHAQLAAQLLDAGAAIDPREANDITPLLMAISNGRMAVARVLIERGAQIDTTDWYGRSPLWSAVNVRNIYLHNETFDHTADRDSALGIIELLLERGADPNPRTRESPPVREHLLSITGTLEWVDFTGQTPFIAAARAGDTTAMRRLLEHGADPHIETFAGTTALMAAAGVNWVVSQTYTEGAESLLEAVKLCHELGLDVNASNSMGITAVHGAANRGSNAIIEFLVEQGAQLDAADNEGRTPLDWARGVFLATHPAEPKPESIALLESLGAS